MNPHQTIAGNNKSKRAKEVPGGKNRGKGTRRRRKKQVDKRKKRMGQAKKDFPRLGAILFDTEKRARGGVIKKTGWGGGH